MNVTDERLRQRAERAIALQSQDHFIVDMRRELPLPPHDSLERLQYSNQRDEVGRYYDYENTWGAFSFDPESARTLLVLRRGNPPDELVPQPRLDLATATAHTGYVSIHRNGKSFELDLLTRDRLGWDTLRIINQTLIEEHIPVVVWQVDEAEGERQPIIRIANDSAMVFASSAIWSPEDQQLIAAQVVTTSQDLLKAIKATLAKNSAKDYLTVKTPEDSAYLKGARRGYITISNNLAQANAEGTVTALLHPLSGDPQAQTTEYFYLVVAPGESLSGKFSERLDLAIPWPIQPQWADYLLEAGQSTGLVQVLESSGADFTAGLKVSKNESQWQAILSDGLKAGRITITQKRSRDG